ncbi:hypothetical protein HMN09_00275200 [Mycena chlorophos]|uniref:Transmembrane protein n=1 Tax=Mycena chlorophos TaxID=658473 RepID=A0A8H6TKE4_MYCCL|nr:hypothetical protein HMN09_00275200 [Mycena chlorophos]
MASEVYGSLVCAVAVNLVLFTLEFYMACRLFSKNREEVSSWTKFRVWFTLLIDTIATLTSCAFLYMFQGSHWGEGDEVQQRFWKIIIATLIIGTFASALAQSFLLERFWKNIRHHLLGTAFAVSILVLAVLASVSSIVACAYLQWINADLEIIKSLVWTALIANLVCALGITLVSVCQRYAMRTMGPRPAVLSRVFRAFVDTGMPSSIIVLLALIAWAVNQNGAFVIALYFIQARVYSCTMLYALSQPKLVREDSWKEEMVSNSVAQRPQPPPPSISPDIFLRIEKSGRLSVPEAEKGQRWFNIDLGEAEKAEKEAAAKREASARAPGAGSPKAMVVHRNSAPFSFYRVPVPQA